MIPLSLHCALAAAQCIVIGPVSLWVRGCVCVRVGKGKAVKVKEADLYSAFIEVPYTQCAQGGWVCYHDNSKLRASILTKLGLWVKVVTISS